MSVHVVPQYAAPLVPHCVLDAFADAPHEDGGWCVALEALVGAGLAKSVRLEAVGAGDRWTIAHAGGSRPSGAARTLHLISHDEVEFLLALAEVDEAIAASLPVLAHVVADAVRVQLALETRVLQLSAQAFVRAGLQPVLCRPDAGVLHAPQWLRGQRRLRTSGGRLRAADPEDDRRLRAAIRAAALEAQDQVLVLGRGSELPAVADVLPALTGPTPFLRHAVLLLRGRLFEQRERAPLLQQLFGLTMAEAMVALAITNGARVSDIAASRGVAVSTIRTQVQTALAKIGVRCQLELIQRVAAVC